MDCSSCGNQRGPGARFCGQCGAPTGGDASVLLRAERIDPHQMVTDRITLDALPEAFEALRKPSTQCKVIVEP